MFDFKGPQGILFLKYRAQQVFSPSLNKLEIFFWMPKEVGFEVSNLIEVPYGEWLLVTFEAHSGNSVYTLEVEKYGTATISG